MNESVNPSSYYVNKWCTIVANKKSMLADRLKLYKQLEEQRESNLIVYITSDRQNAETNIGADVFISEGTITRLAMPGGQSGIQDNRNFEGWKHK